MKGRIPMYVYYEYSCKVRRLYKTYIAMNPLDVAFTFMTLSLVKTLTS